MATDSFLIGYTLTIIVAVLDRILLNYPFSKQYINKPLRGLLIVLAFIASVNVWRGVWSIYDNFLFPNVDHFLNYLVSALLAYLVLALFKAITLKDKVYFNPCNALLRILTLCCLSRSGVRGLGVRMVCVDKQRKYVEWQSFIINYTAKLR